MARKIFIAATSQNSGKTTTSLSLMYMARKKYDRVGFIKPLGPKPDLLNGVEADKDAILMAEVYGLESDLPLMSPVVLQPGHTQQVLDGTLSAENMRTRMQDAIAELDRKNDFLIIEGAGHTGVGSVIGFSNARVAALANIYQFQEYRSKLVGLVIPGTAPISAITQKILDQSGIPYMRTSRTTVDVFVTISEDVSKLNAQDTEKINLVTTLADKRFDFDVLDELFQ